MLNNQNTVVFEANDKVLAAELLRSSTSFKPSDVRNLANVGAIAQEDAKEILSTMEGSVVKLDKDIKCKVLHKKALICLGKEKNDPLINELIRLHSEQEKIYEELDKKYGEEAKVNQGSLISKLLTKFRGNPEASIMESCKKISEFQ
jgi:hypothetical protein